MRPVTTRPGSRFRILQLLSACLGRWIPTQGAHLLKVLYTLIPLQALGGVLPVGQRNTGPLVNFGTADKCPNFGSADK